MTFRISPALQAIGTCATAVAFIGTIAVSSAAMAIGSYQMSPRIIEASPTVSPSIYHKWPNVSKMSVADVTPKIYHKWPNTHTVLTVSVIDPEIYHKWP